jgi:hypothetical protein
MFDLIFDSTQSFIPFLIAIAACLLFILLAFASYDFFFGPLSKKGCWGEESKPFDQEVD